MNRELLLIGLAALVCGGVVWSVAPLHGAVAAGPTWRRERRAWRGVIAPLVVIAFGTTMLLGWAVQEPQLSDERLAPFAWAFAIVVLLLWTRALVRFVQSIMARPALPIAVVGVLNPRIVVDPNVERVLDTDALAAALAHEQAHVRHRDPLRIAMAQLATDLQWPWPQPRRRLAAWRDLLEETRDDEAIVGGANPDDLAAAIIEAARWSTRGGGAALTNDRPFERRISRLLDGATRSRAPRSVIFSILFTSGLVASLVVGLTVGDDLLALWPGVLR